MKAPPSGGRSRQWASSLPTILEHAEGLKPAPHGARFLTLRREFLVDNPMLLRVRMVALHHSTCHDSGRETQLNVPFLDLRSQYLTIRDDVRAALDAVCESQHFILGQRVTALEQEIARYCGTRYAVGVS